MGTAINPMFHADYGKFQERIERRYGKYKAERKLRRAGLGFRITKGEKRAAQRAANVPEFGELDGGPERL